MRQSKIIVFFVRGSLNCTRRKWNAQKYANASVLGGQNLRWRIVLSWGLWVCVCVFFFLTHYIQVCVCVYVELLDRFAKAPLYTIRAILDLLILHTRQKETSTSRSDLQHPHEFANLPLINISLINHINFHSAAAAPYQFDSCRNLNSFSLKLGALLQCAMLLLLFFSFLFFITGLIKTAAINSTTTTTVWQRLFLLF